ncbi:MAG: hypothetical protein BHV94_05660 [Clostridiales bacterium 59_14]|nr:MAG: hypothetical protein BHV94_05660 [Clostridiales bacterium 59_14]
MADKISMNTQDAVSANFAECFVTLNGTRYSMLMAKEFEGKASINTKEVYRLGNPVIGHKAQTIALAFSMTVYKCTEIFDQVVEDFIKTGVMPTFDIQTSNDDPATSVGRGTRIKNTTTACWTVMCCCPCSTQRVTLWSRPLRATATASPAPKSTPTRPICKGGQLKEEIIHE